MNRRRLIRRVRLLFKLLAVVLVVSSVGFGFSAWDLFLNTQVSNTEEYKHVASTCDKKVWKARWDCRKLLVDNHYDKWQEHKGMILAYCDDMATKMYCKPIGE
jgi:hypothetical protein|tara:strand:+ start:17 stop:325 length:309 start_codon:yes stop_codon:yes gene_type:complete